MANKTTHQQNEAHNVEHETMEHKPKSTHIAFIYGIQLDIAKCLH